jgi:hypothetical protein
MICNGMTGHDPFFSYGSNPIQNHDGRGNSQSISNPKAEGVRYQISDFRYINIDSSIHPEDSPYSFKLSGLEQERTSSLGSTPSLLRHSIPKGTKEAAKNENENESLDDG